MANDLEAENGRLTAFVESHFKIADTTSQGDES